VPIMARITNTILILLALASTAGAQAYCGLRDPNKQIYSLFPEADSYRSLVRTVSPETRAQVATRLPFTLHMNELGRHTLYVAQQDARPLGFVQVRSEASRWGLVEIAWAFDLDMKVLGFEFQRCRDRNKDLLDTAAVREKLIGASFSELRPLLDRTGTGLSPEALPVAPEASSLALVLVRNGLKTMAATESVWRTEILTLRAGRLAEQLVPNFGTLRDHPVRYAARVLDTLDAQVGPRGTGIDRATSLAWQLIDQDGQSAGWLARVDWDMPPIDHGVWWWIDAGGAVRKVQPEKHWPTAEISEAFDGIEGMSIATLQGCAGPVELTALEVLLTVLPEGFDPRTRE